MLVFAPNIKFFAHSVDNDIEYWIFDSRMHTHMRMGWIIAIYKIQSFTHAAKLWSSCNDQAGRNFDGL